MPEDDSFCLLKLFPLSVIWVLSMWYDTIWIIHTHITSNMKNSAEHLPLSHSEFWHGATSESYAVWNLLKYVRILVRVVAFSSISVFSFFFHFPSALSFCGVTESCCCCDNSGESCSQTMCQICPWLNSDLLCTALWSSIFIPCIWAEGFTKTDGNQERLFRDNNKENSYFKLYWIFQETSPVRAHFFKTAYTQGGHETVG